MNVRETKEMIDFMSSYTFNKNRSVIIECFRKFTSFEVKSLQDILNLKYTYPEFIFNNIQHFNCSFDRKMYISDQLTEFSFFLDNYLDDDKIKNREAYSNILTELLPNGKNTKIVDVGAGELALSSIYMHDKVSGQIDAYDNDQFYIAENVAGFFNVKLLNKKFKPSTNVNNYDLIMGYTPCKATGTLVKNARKNGKPYFIKFCTCGLPSKRQFGDPRKQWLDYLKDFDPDVKVHEDYIYNIDVSDRQLANLIEKYDTRRLSNKDYDTAAEIIDGLVDIFLLGISGLLNN